MEENIFNSKRPIKGEEIIFFIPLIPLAPILSPLLVSQPHCHPYCQLSPHILVMTDDKF